MQLIFFIITYNFILMTYRGENMINDINLNLYRVFYICAKCGVSIDI